MSKFPEARVDADQPEDEEPRRQVKSSRTVRVDRRRGDDAASIEPIDDPAGGAPEDDDAGLAADGESAPEADDEAGDANLQDGDPEDVEEGSSIGSGRADGAWFDANVSTSTLVWFGVGSGLIILAGIALAAASWGGPNEVAGADRYVAVSAVVAAVSMSLGLLCMTVGGFQAMRRSSEGVDKYAPFIFGLGVLMCGVGGVGIIGVAGLMHHGGLTREQLAHEADAVASDTPDESTGNAIMEAIQEGDPTDHRRARFVLLAAAMGFIGSFLYTALALWRKQQGHEDEERFDIGKLVSGGALRAGEALLFVLVFVLLTQVQDTNELDGWLPVVGLMLGMFVKSGERVVFNIAQRIFAIVQAGLGPPAPPETDEGKRPSTRE